MDTAVFELMSEGARLPEQQTKGAAGYDLYCPHDVIVQTGRNVIPLDIRANIPDGYHMEIRPRSGFSLKGFEGHVLVLNEDREVIDYAPITERFNADVLLGTIDSDYEGVIGVLVRNADIPFLVTAGTRIAQGVFVKNADLRVIAGAITHKSERGSGGFGSTGTDAHATQ